MKRIFQFINKAPPSQLLSSAFHCGRLIGVIFVLSIQVNKQSVELFVQEACKSKYNSESVKIFQWIGSCPGVANPRHQGRDTSNQRCFSEDHPRI